MVIIGVSTIAVSCERIVLRLETLNAIEAQRTNDIQQGDRVLVGETPSGSEQEIRRVTMMDGGDKMDSKAIKKKKNRVLLRLGIYV